MSLTLRKTFTAALIATSSLLAACSDDNGPTGLGLQAPAGLSVSALSSTRTQLTFTGSRDDDSYVVERAAGATGGTFARIGTASAPASGSQVVYVDSIGLVAGSDYQYRVAAVRDGQTSGFSASQAVRTLAPGRAQVEISQDITADRTFYPDTTYILKGFIHVANGATLTILPGTTIQGDYETVGSSLFVLRGAKINAVGTAAQPIVFTSERPVGERKPGDWGGLIIVGNADLNRGGEIEIEGTGTVTGTTSGTNYPVYYSKGSNPADNSGELRYVRVEFAGYGPALNEELNSFTFATVGSGTKLSYLQALGGLDDHYEWFGGSVDAKYLVSYEAGDDHFDMSEGFNGRLQYLIAFQDTILPPREAAGSPSSDPQAIENDGCSGTGCTNGFAATPYTQPIVSNFTLVGTGKTALSASSGGWGMVLRRGTAGYYVNGVIARFARGGISIRDAETFARAGSVAIPDLATADLAIRNVVTAEVNAKPFDDAAANFRFDLAGNAITASTATTASLFTAFPSDATSSTTEAAFDWTPAAGSPAATGGLATFTGKLQAKAGGVVTGTSFLGAAPPAGSADARWWAGWTKYAQN